MRGWRERIAGLGMSLMLMTSTGYAQEVSVLPISEAEGSVPTQQEQVHEELKSPEISTETPPVTQGDILTASDEALQLSEEVLTPDVLKEQPQPSEEDLFLAEELDRHMAGSPLPKKFDLNKKGLIGKIRNRLDGTKGKDSWMYAAIGAFESRVRAADLPENWEYYSVKRLEQNAGCKKPNQTDLLQNPSTGDQNLALAYFAAWKGPILEKYDDSCCPKDLRRHKTLLGAYFMDSKVDTIKRMIYDHGSAVQVRIHMTQDPPDMSDPESYDREFYNEKTHSQYVYQWKEIEPNEDILIVGWDDDYEYDKFSVHPIRNGAFICRRTKQDKVGQQGEFFLSYMDKSLNRRDAEALMYYAVKDPDPKERLYQHDEYGLVGSIDSEGKKKVSFANIFERERLQPELLEAVSFYSLEDHLDYEVWVNVQGGSGQSMLDSPAMIRVPVREYRSLPRGYHTVWLEQPQLLKGKNFAVMIKPKAEGTSRGNVVALEYRTDRLPNVEVNPGESFVRYDEAQWQDTSEKNIYIRNKYGQLESVSANVCLKAMTKIVDVLEEPQELKEARMFNKSGYQNVYTDKVWEIKFSDELDEDTLKEIKVYKQENYEKMKLKLDLRKNDITNKKDTVRVLVQDQWWPTGTENVSYEPGKSYILYIGNVKGKLGSNGYQKSLRQPVKFYFTVRNK